jgi:hypothetical protein
MPSFKQTSIKLTLIALALFGVSIFNVSSAQSFGGWFGNRAPNGAAVNGTMPAQMQQRIRARMEQRKQEFLNELALSSTQRQQWDALSASRANMRNTQKAERSAFRVRLSEALEAGADVTAWYQEHLRLQDTHTAQRRQLQQSYLAFYQSLNPTQQAKLRNHLLEMLDRVEENRARRGD